MIAESTAEAALRVLRERAIDLLFTDIRLSGSMNGWRLGEEAVALHSSLPVIYTTGYISPPPRRMPQGALLQKPYLPSALLETIRGVLRRTGPSQVCVQGRS